jgi:chemosensory pili system protein ChpA (sensor histidine kinase/response regulator)
VLLGRVDREIHRFADGGEAWFAESRRARLVKNLLYYVAQADASRVLRRASPTSVRPIASTRCCRRKPNFSTRKAR